MTTTVEERGWIAHADAGFPEVAVVVLTAILAGGVVMNALKEELPEERESSFGAFAVGAALSAAIVLVDF